MNPLRSSALIGSLVLLTLDARSASSQQAAESRTRAIVASFNKSKHLVKEKYGVRKEKYLDVRSEPALKSNPTAYSGTYEAPGLGFSLTLRVDELGKVEGTGYEPVNDDATVSRNFALKNGQTRGALLTATKVYADGSAEPLEGVFINKTVFESTTDKGTTAFGLGVVGKRFQIGGLSIDRIFYQAK